MRSRWLKMTDNFPFFLNCLGLLHDGWIKYMRLIKTGLKQISAWAAITHLSTKMAGFARRSLLGIKYSGLVAICSPKQKHNKLIFLSSKMSFIRSIRRKHGFPNRAIIITAKLIYFTTQTQIFDKNTTLTLIDVK